MRRSCPQCTATATLQDTVVTCNEPTCGYAYHEDAKAPWREGLDWRPGAPTYATDAIYYKFVRTFLSRPYHRKNGSF